MKIFKPVPRPHYLFRHHCPSLDWEVIHEYDPAFAYCQCDLPQQDGYGSDAQRQLFRKVLGEAIDRELFHELNPPSGALNADNTNHPDHNNRPTKEGSITPTRTETQALNIVQGPTPSPCPNLDWLARRG